MRLLAYLRAGRGAPRNAVVAGPRGNGKTVLLRWFQREIEAGGGIDVVWRTPSDLPALDALATALGAAPRFQSLLPDKLSVSIGVGRLGWELGGDPGTLTELLTLRCAHRPLVILLDEAHHAGRGGRTRAAQRRPVHGVGCALPAGAGGDARSHAASRPDVRDVLEPREAHRRRPARRGRRRGGSGAAFRRAEARRHLRRAGPAARGRREPVLSILPASLGGGPVGGGGGTGHDADRRGGGRPGGTDLPGRAARLLRAPPRRIGAAEPDAGR